MFAVEITGKGLHQKVISFLGPHVFINQTDFDLEFEMRYCFNPARCFSSKTSLDHTPL